MNDLAMTRTNDRVEDLRTRYVALALALTSVFVATSLACYAVGLRGAPGRPGMFLVDGVFSMARAMGFLPALIATFLLLGSSAVALLTNASFRSLGMRAIEAVTAGFLISVLVGSLGHADGGTLGLLLGARLARMMSTPIASVLCGITAVLAIWLVIEGNLRECARVGRLPLGAFPARETTPLVATPQPLPSEAAAETVSVLPDMAPAVAPEASAFEPTVEEAPPETSAGALEEPAATATAVLPEAPTADPEVRIRPRRFVAPPRIERSRDPRPREWRPEISSVETGPMTSNRRPDLSSEEGVGLAEPDPTTQEPPIDEPHQADAAQDRNPGADPERSGPPGIAELPGPVGGDLARELLEPAPGLARDEGVEDLAAAGEVERVEAVALEAGVLEGESQESAGLAVAPLAVTPLAVAPLAVAPLAVAPLADEPEALAEAPLAEAPLAADGTDGLGVREPAVIVMTVPEVAYVETESWDLPRTIPDAAPEPNQPAAAPIEAAELANVPAPEEAHVEADLARLVKEYDSERATATAVAEPDAKDPETATDHEIDGVDVPELDRAVRLVLGEGRASISFLQRKLQVTFNTAQHLMAQLESTGVVGPYRGNPSRDILLTLSEWEARRPE